MKCESTFSARPPMAAMTFPAFHRSVWQAAQTGMNGIVRRFTRWDRHLLNVKNEWRRDAPNGPRVLISTSLIRATRREFCRGTRRVFTGPWCALFRSGQGWRQRPCALCLSRRRTGLLLRSAVSSAYVVDEPCGNCGSGLPGVVRGLENTCNEWCFPGLESGVLM